MEITSLDLTILKKEFQDLEDGYVQKVYQRKDELTLEIYVPGDEKKRLIIGPNYCFISNYKRDNPKRPPGFCMELRKHLGKVENIKQKGFDRILEIHCGEKKLICELFGKGNFILTDKNDIIGAYREEKWEEREIRVGKKYKYPEIAEDPRKKSDYFKLLKKGELVRRLASDLNLGGTYAEEICSNLDLDKTKKTEEINEKEKKNVNKAIKTFFQKAEDPEPVLYKENQKPVRACPFTLNTYKNHSKEVFNKFSRALDEYFYRKQTKKQEEKQKRAYNEKKKGLERQLQQQKKKKQGLEKSSKQNREKAELIYKNYQRLQKINENLEEIIDKNGWKTTKKRLKESETELSEKVNTINEKDEFFSIKTENKNIKLKPGEKLEAAASRYYDKAKESEKKLESVEKALKNTEKELENLDETKVNYEETMEDKTQKRNKKWFEKYRWFYSSEDFLVIIGRDAQTNEMAVKKHMEDKDMFFHADFDGAPAVVVKKGQEAGDETFQQAAQAAVTFSKTWKAGIGSDDVYHVEPGQVTKNPESGEYLEKGAFVIRGDREYLRNVSVEAAIGPYEIDGETVPMTGPVKAVKNHCEEYLELEPGNKKKSRLAKKIRKDLKQKGYDLDLDYIIRSLPPGKSRIK